MFLPFWFYVGFVLVIFLLSVMSCFLFCFQSVKTDVFFPSNSVFGLNSRFLMCNAFVLAFLLLVLSVCSLNNEVALFVSVLSTFFYVNKTQWFSGLRLVVLFLFWLFCVHFFVFLVFHSFPKRPQNRTLQN